MKKGSFVNWFYLKKEIILPVVFLNLLMLDNAKGGISFKMCLFLVQAYEIYIFL